MLPAGPSRGNLCPATLRLPSALALAQTRTTPSALENFRVYFGAEDMKAVRGRVVRATSLAADNAAVGIAPYRRCATPARKTLRIRDVGGVRTADRLRGDGSLPDTTPRDPCVRSLNDGRIEDCTCRASVRPARRLAFRAAAADRAALTRPAVTRGRRLRVSRPPKIMETPKRPSGSQGEASGPTARRAAMELCAAAEHAGASAGAEYSESSTVRRCRTA